jgi:hypothetical protein
VQGIPLAATIIHQCFSPLSTGFGLDTGNGVMDVAHDSPAFPVFCELHLPAASVAPVAPRRAGVQYQSIIPVATSVTQEVSVLQEESQQLKGAVK